MWQEFKPTIFFLLKFFLVYFGLSIMYGLFISGYDTSSPPKTDPITRFVTFNCTNTASIFGYSTSVVKNDHLNHSSDGEQTYDSIWLNNIYAVSVEEGCNGINIMILFMSFVIAFGGKLLNTLIFIPTGILFIHLSNIGRLMLLSLINVEWGGRAFHFFHKYGFTAIIYLSVLLLWYLWVSRFSGKAFFKKKK